MNLNSLKRALALAIIWERIKHANLRDKLAWGYAFVFTILFAIGFSTIYLISKNYRQQAFYQLLKDRMLTTYKLMVEVDQVDADMLKVIDRNKINSLYDEKVLLFDSSFRMIYSSLDDTKIYYPTKLLSQLRDGKDEIRLEEGCYEVLGIRFRYGAHVYYGIAKAYDRFGKNKLLFLRTSLSIIFIVIVVLLVLLSLYLARIITLPISRLTKELDAISTDKLSVRINQPPGRHEVALLTSKFNELLDKVESAFRFQDQFVHHISHELKTPLAVMITNAEAALAEQRKEAMAGSLNFLRHSLMEMSHIINAMLDISKTESQLGNVLGESIRLDELLFECIDEVGYWQTDAEFDFRIDDSIQDSENLTIQGSGRMLKIAFMNLLKNAVIYASSERPAIEILSDSGTTTVIISNDGATILDNEVDRVFTYLFRGANSKAKKGFGIGLVLVHRIITLHQGIIRYTIRNGKNCFTVSFPKP